MNKFWRIFLPLDNSENGLLFPEFHTFNAPSGSERSRECVHSAQASCIGVCQSDYQRQAEGESLPLCWQHTSSTNCQVGYIPFEERKSSYLLAIRSLKLNYPLCR